MLRETIYYICTINRYHNLTLGEKYTVSVTSVVSGVESSSNEVGTFVVRKFVLHAIRCDPQKNWKKLGRKLFNHVQTFSLFETQQR